MPVHLMLNIENLTYMFKCKNTPTYILNKQVTVLNKHFCFKNKYFK